MPFWAAAQLQPQRERLAQHCLTLAGYETYAPRLRERHVAYGRKVIRTPFLFPGYLFVLIELQWSQARWSPGVARIVMDGMAPARVPDAVIDEIRAREVAGLIELPKPPPARLGDAIKILRGPFEGRLAIYAGMKPRARIEVLLSLLGSQQRMTLAADAVEAI
jgi:transcriptional antiterminator RfaH